MYNVYLVESHSMYPALNDGDYILTKRMVEYNTGDIVVFSHENSFIVKRIISTTINNIHINDYNYELIQSNVLEPYQSETNKNTFNYFKTLRMVEVVNDRRDCDHLIVLGDNIFLSNYYLLCKSDIVGAVVFKY